MKNQLIQLDKELAKETAHKAFEDMCGYNKGKPASKKIVEKSLKSLNDIYSQIDIQAVVSEYEGTCVKGADLMLEGQTFVCDALKQIPAGDVDRVYIYLLTSGEPDSGESSILSKVYYDMWQNAYMDAGQEMLGQHLQQFACNQGRYVSDTFGPGFFGMEASQLKQFFAILDGDKIGVKLLESGFMFPQKSFAGFFLVTRSKQNLLANSCEHCLSPGKTCMYCKKGRSMS
jgi:hypothetical protein